MFEGHRDLVAKNNPGHREKRPENREARQIDAAFRSEVWNIRQRNEYSPGSGQIPPAYSRHESDYRGAVVVVPGPGAGLPPHQRYPPAQEKIQIRNAMMMMIHKHPHPGYGRLYVSQ